MAPFQLWSRETETLNYDSTLLDSVFVSLVLLRKNTLNKDLFPFFSKNRMFFSNV